MELHRLSGRKRCDRVRTRGTLWKGKHFFVRWIPGAPAKDDPAGIYVGLVASTKLHKSAVKRNRMRRRCREALRITLNDVSKQEAREGAGLGLRQAQTALSLSKGAGPAPGAPPLRERMVHGRKTEGCPSVSVQLLLFPKSSSLSADFREILADVSHFLAFLPHAR